MYLFGVGGHSSGGVVDCSQCRGILKGGNSIHAVTIGGGGNALVAKIILGVMRGWWLSI